MIRFQSSALKLAMLFLSTCIPVCAQSLNFLPETDAHLTLNSTFRVYLQAKDNHATEVNRREIYDWPRASSSIWKPLIKLKKVRAFQSGQFEVKIVGSGDRVPSHHRTGCPVCKSYANGGDFQLPREGRLCPLGSQPRGSRLERRQIHLALSEQIDDRPNFCDPFLSPHSVCRSGNLLREPVQQMEHHFPLCGWLVPRGQTRPIRHLL